MLTFDVHRVISKVFARIQMKMKVKMKMKRVISKVFARIRMKMKTMIHMMLNLKKNRGVSPAASATSTRRNTDLKVLKRNPMP